MSDELGLGTPAGVETPAPAAAPIAAPAVTAPAIPQAAPQAPASGAPTPEPGWIKQRLDETRASTTRQLQADFQRREAEHVARYQAMERKLQVLAGVVQPPNPEETAVRGQFGQLYPGLSKIEERAQQIMELLDRSGDLESQNTHYWQSYGRQTMDRLFTHAQESLGAPLTEDGKRQLHSAFVGFVQSTPENQSRYTSDPSLVQDFWKQFTSSFIDPVRRTAAAGVAARAAQPGLPQDTPSGAPRAAGAPPLGNLEDRVNAAWATYEQTKR